MEDNNKVVEETQINEQVVKNEQVKEPSKNEMLREMSKEYGVNLFDVEGLKKFKEFQDSQKTELEKLQEKIKEFESNSKTKEDEYSNKITEYENKILGYEFKVKNESLDEALTLAKLNASKKNIELKESMKEIAEKYPFFIDSQTQNVIKIGDQTNDNIQHINGKSPILEAVYKKLKK